MLSINDKKLAIYEWMAALKDDRVIDLIFKIMAEYDAGEEVSEEYANILFKRYENYKNSDTSPRSWEDLRKEINQKYGV